MALVALLKRHLAVDKWTATVKRTGKWRGNEQERRDRTPEVSVSCWMGGRASGACGGGALVALVALGRAAEWTGVMRKRLVSDELDTVGGTRQVQRAEWTDAARPINGTFIHSVQFDCFTVNSRVDLTFDWLILAPCFKMSNWTFKRIDKRSTLTRWIQVIQVLVLKNC